MPASLQKTIAGLNLIGPPKLPADLALNSAQRQAVERLVSEGEAVLAPGPAAEILEAVSPLLETFPTSSNTNSKARGMGFRIALEDLPAWCVQEAVKRWLRGEDGDGSENYSFAPSPPQLRRLAIRAKAGAELRLRNFRRLLQAEVIPLEGPKTFVPEADVKALLQSVTQGTAAVKMAEAAEKVAAMATARAETEAWAERIKADMDQRLTFPEAAE